MSPADAGLAHRQTRDLDVELHRTPRSAGEPQRRLFFIEAREHDRREARQQQCAVRIELIGIARAHELDDASAARSRSSGVEHRRGLGRNRDRRQPLSLRLDARRLVLLEIDVDEQRVFGLERLVDDARLARQLIALTIGQAAVAIALAARSGSAALGAAEGRPAQAKLFHEGLTVLRTHGLQ